MFVRETCFCAGAKFPRASWLHVHQSLNGVFSSTGLKFVWTAGGKNSCCRCSFLKQLHGLSGTGARPELVLSLAFYFTLHGSWRLHNSIPQELSLVLETNSHRVHWTLSTNEAEIAISHRNPGRPQVPCVPQDFFKIIQFSGNCEQILSSVPSPLTKILDPPQETDCFSQSCVHFCF